MPAAWALSFDNLLSVPKTLLTSRVITLTPERFTELCRALGAATGCRRSTRARELGKNPPRPEPKDSPPPTTQSTDLHGIRRLPEARAAVRDPPALRRRHPGVNEEALRVAYRTCEVGQTRVEHFFGGSSRR